MTIPQLPDQDAGRARWFKIAAAVWLLLVSILAAVNSVGLSRLTEQSQASAQDAHVQALNARVAKLEQQAAISKSQPKPDFEAARIALDERLVQVEQAQATDVHASDVQALQARVGDIEARMKRTATPTAAPRRTAEPAKPKVPEAPFNVVGVELRGGERFLLVAAPKASSVLDVWLLREGDAVGGWHLLAIEARAAVFRVDGQTQRIALP
jgi:polyhydroxyalkanoate synthesis regulator phasin